MAQYKYQQTHCREVGSMTYAAMARKCCNNMLIISTLICPLSCSGGGAFPVDALHHWPASSRTPAHQRLNRSAHKENKNVARQKKQGTKNDPRSRRQRNVTPSWGQVPKTRTATQKRYQQRWARAGHRPVDEIGFWDDPVRKTVASIRGSFMHWRTS